MIGGMRLTGITAKHIDELLSTLQCNGHSGGDYSARGINMAREVLRNCMNVAYRWGLITANPVVLTRTISGESYTPPAIGEDEFLLVRKALSASHHDRPLLVCLLSGMRFSECLGLTIDALDFDNHCIHVKQQLLDQKSGFEVSTTKTSKSKRVLPMTPGLREILEQQVSYVMNLPSPPAGFPGLLFRTSNGTPIAHNNLRRRFKKVLETNDLPHMRVHDLRHAYTSILIQKGVPAKAVSDLLGHTSVSITVNRYAHMTNVLNAQFVSLLDNIGK
jgi:integrase